MSYSEPPPPPPQYGAPVPPYGGQPDPGKSKAIWSLVTGILSIICCSPLGIVAIILGRGARADAAAVGAPANGMAKAGVILGIIGLVLLVLTIILYATGALSFNGSFETS